MDTRPIGVFDSGVGGLSILRQIRETLAQEDLLFLADQLHVPYGNRSLSEVRQFSESITRFLLNQGAKLIVVACNTASAAALHHLRTVFPGTPFVGMEPAVKPAAQSTHSRVVGVLATPATFQGALFASVVERFANDVVILEQTLPGLVDQIEAGELDGATTREILRQAIDPLLTQGVDTLVLACTHYPFIIPILTELVGPDVQVIDPSPAIARQVKRLLERHALGTPADRTGRVIYHSSTDAEQLALMAMRLIGEQGEARFVHWSDDQISLTSPSS
ncbi:MAG: glutamate racemase [Anaerolineales bacterium]|nr:glutamate racemase [Anaerolineales bacterium]